MSKYVMNKFIHHVNMNEAAENEYRQNPRAFIEKWEQGEKLKLTPERARSAGNERLRQALRAGRPPVHALELHRSRLGT